MDGNNVHVHLVARQLAQAIVIASGDSILVLFLPEVSLDGHAPAMVGALLIGDVCCP